ncbi:hypothetical protein [Nocardia brasiliensis]|uniref:hypothetical protein n=1 Tax=Nocardia brasiliensis TaxID=37326 RepID=UPI001EECDAEE|nr:hypothetical protein [Nocardia brasiliensis]
MPEQPPIAERDWPVELIHPADDLGAAQEGAADEPDPPEAPAFETFSIGEASLRGGEIVVTATDSGLPTAVRVVPDQLRRHPDELAEDILRLCRLAADRAGLRRREYLSGLGLGEDALRLLGLPTAQTLEQSELADEARYDYEPRSWLDQGGSRW